MKDIEIMIGPPDIGGDWFITNEKSGITFILPCGISGGTGV